MSREQFEQLVTVPEWVAFDPVHGYSNPEWQDLDPATNFVRLDELSRINAAWKAYQSRQSEIDALHARIAELEAENHALLARAAVLVDALELARGEIAHYFKEIRHLGGSWEVKRALDRVDQVLDAYPRHGDAQPKEPGNE